MSGCGDFLPPISKPGHVKFFFYEHIKPKREYGRDGLFSGSRSGLQEGSDLQVVTTLFDRT